MVNLLSQTKSPIFSMILAWACPFNKQNACLYTTCLKVIDGVEGMRVKINDSRRSSPCPILIHILKSVTDVNHRQFSRSIISCFLRIPYSGSISFPVVEKDRHSLAGYKNQCGLMRNKGALRWRCPTSNQCLYDVLCD